jgi:elongation factor P
MSIKAINLNIGSYIKLNNKIWKLIDKSHVKPGKGPAYLQAKLKSLEEGIKLEHRFSSNDVVEQVIVEQKPYQFAYKEKNSIFLTDNTTYETIEIQEQHISKESWHLLSKFAQENMDIFIEFANDNIMDISLPNSLEVLIEMADPVIKGQTATSSYKNAIIKEDIKILVPPYIKAGDKILINLYSEKGIEFLERKQ